MNITKGIQPTMPEPLRQYRNVDHLILGTPSLESTVALLSERIGLTPYFGGSHPQHGTSNYLLPVGGRTYLEILGASAPRAELDAVGQLFVSLPGPRLMGIALETSNIDETLAIAQDRQLKMEEREPGARRTPEGTLLQWEGVHFDRRRFEGMLFFAIDWKNSPHPSAGTASAATLSDLEIGFQDTDRVEAYLALLGSDVPVKATPGPMSLGAKIKGPGGALALSSTEDPA